MWRVFLGQRGLNASKARDAVVTTFLESKDHVDLQALYARAKRRQPGVGFATVYRTPRRRCTRSPSVAPTMIT
jgi:Fur family transcriptional regulator, ferric uptake regulator